MESRRKMMCHELALRLTVKAHDLAKVLAKFEACRDAFRVSAICETQTKQSSPT